MISEKSYGLLDENKYTFVVRPGANKTEIKRPSRTFRRQGDRREHHQPAGKRKRTRFGCGKRKDTKRAIVSLAEGERIDIFGGPVALSGRDETWDHEIMGIRKYKPTTPGRRGSSVADFVEVTRAEPEKSLVRPLPKKGGRNVHGRITTRHQGGGHKRAYRVIDFRRADKDGVPAKVAHIEYDPNRTARIALLHYADGEKRYILCPTGAEAGRPRRERPVAPTSSRATACRCATSRPVRSCTRSSCGPAAAPRWPARPAPASSCSPRRASTPRCGCPPARCAMVDLRCRATVGEVGNSEQSNINWGKAGRMRWKGKRPTVRGVAMNPIDHPHGGGEGKTSGGRHPSSPWGQPEGRTRRAEQASATGSSSVVVARRSGRSRADAT